MELKTNTNNDLSLFRYTVDMFKSGIYGYEISEMIDWCKDNNIEFHRVVLTFRFKTEQDKLLFIMRFK